MSTLTAVLYRVDWRWVVTAAIALYGAGLSTYNAYVARKQSRRQIKVTLTWGIMTFGEKLGHDVLILSASNPGQRAVTLVAGGFTLPDGRQMVFPYLQGTQLPHHLIEGTGCKHYVAIRDVARDLARQGFSGTVTLRARYLDAVDVYHSSKPFPFKINEWL